jgi:proteasome component ECM29
MADVDEQRELQLVDRLELRLALAKDAGKFESLLNTYLCPLLLKLKSPSLNVRNKTVSICMHLSTRIEGDGVYVARLVYRCAMR